MPHKPSLRSLERTARLALLAIANAPFTIDARSGALADLDALIDGLQLELNAQRPGPPPEPGFEEIRI